MQQALGLLETKGLVGAIEGADAMAKAAEIRILNKELVEGGLVIIKIIGDVAAVKAAVDAGAAAAEKVGELLGSHIIPRPDKQIDAILDVEILPAAKVSKVMSTELESLTVQKLRTLAREQGEAFPILGREISKANKDALIAAFKKIRK